MSQQKKGPRKSNAPEPPDVSVIQSRPDSPSDRTPLIEIFFRPSKPDTKGLDMIFKRRLARKARDNESEIALNSTSDEPKLPSTEPTKPIVEVIDIIYF